MKDMEKPASNWRIFCIAFFLAVLIPLGVQAQSSVADILEGVDMSDLEARRSAVAGIRALQEQRRAAGVARARQLGMPERVVRPDGAVQEVADVDERGVPVYLTTHNANAAISTGAKVLNAAPYDLQGTNALTLAVWDGGSARPTHQEFGGRVSVRDGSPSIDHATHVAGTMAASGVVAAAKGMAPLAPIASYDWNSDKAEMASATPSIPRRLPTPAPARVFLAHFHHRARTADRELKMGYPLHWETVSLPRLGSFRQWQAVGPRAQGVNIPHKMLDGEVWFLRTHISSIR